MTTSIEDTSSFEDLQITRKIFRISNNSDSILKVLYFSHVISFFIESFFQILNEQRLKNRSFCDVTILVEHERFKAHKCVLAASSPYFDSLLARDNDGIFLRHIKSSSFKAILDFIYTSKISLNSESLQDILKTAKFLQIKNVVSICCR